MAKRMSPNGLVRNVLKNFMDTSGVEPRLLGPNFRIVNAVEGKVDFELDIKREHTNRLSILHGGTIACMVDLGGSLAIASKGLFATGVSTDINVTYIGSGGKVGDRLKGSAVIDKIGKTLAFTTVTFMNAKGDLVARGSHTKYVTQAHAANPHWTAPEGYQDEGVD